MQNSERKAEACITHTAFHKMHGNAFSEFKSCGHNYNCLSLLCLSNTVSVQTINTQWYIFFVQRIRVKIYYPATSTCTQDKLQELNSLEQLPRALFWEIFERTAWAPAPKPLPSKSSYSSLNLIS